MKNLFFIFAFSLLGTFAFGNDMELSVIDNDTVSEADIFNLDYSVSWDDDICTVTVTITLDNGIRSTGRATSNTGDCGAAESAAYQQARLQLAEIGY